MERHPLGKPEDALPDRLVPIAERPRLDPAPRVFAGSLLDYNAVILHGRWVGVNRPVAAVQDDIDAMLARSPTAAARQTTATDWLILASEGFGGCTVREVEPLERLTDLARRIRTYGLAFAAWAQLDEGNLDHHLKFERAYLGCYDSLEEYVGLGVDAGRYDQLAEAAVPERLRPYVEIRIGDLARDLATAGELITVAAEESGGVFVFDGFVE